MLDSNIVLLFYKNHYDSRAQHKYTAQDYCVNGMSVKKVLYHWPATDSIDYLWQGDKEVEYSHVNAHLSRRNRAR